MPNPEQKLEQAPESRVYRETRELATVEVNSGGFVLIERSDYDALHDAAKKTREAPELDEILKKQPVDLGLGGDGTFRIVAEQEITEVEIPEQHGGGMAKNVRTLRVEFQEIHDQKD